MLDPSAFGYLAINIEGKIGQLTVRRTSSFIIYTLNHNKIFTYPNEVSFKCKIKT